MEPAMTQWSFNRDAIDTFHFRRCAFDARTGVAQLVYAFDDGPELVETITLPGAPLALDDARRDTCERALRLLHLVAGVSYYKAAVPARIAIDAYAIDADTAALLQTIYVNGLGEFAYRNGLDLHGRIVFPALEPSPSRGGLGGDGGASGALGTRIDHHPHPSPSGQRLGVGAAVDTRQWRVGVDPRPLEGEGGRHLAGVGAKHIEGEGGDPRALVAIGGGKDSLVSIEALRDAGLQPTVTWIGGSQLIAACAARTGLPTLNIGRQLAPELFDFNRAGAWNGHIPVTAVNSAILVFAACVLDFGHVVFSNERSASYGSIIEGTGEVNHQWSKGWAFESAFAAHVRAHVDPGIAYYSLLRPLSELAVARQFARMDHYDAHFSSCNRNFHILGERPVNRWCGACPKCHFVFLALAPFMPKPRLVGIFGRNLLDDMGQAAGFDALLEYRDHKPFECVGEGIESRAAMAALARRPEWREDALVMRFAREIAPQLDGDAPGIEPLLALDGEHGVPAAVWERVHARFAA